MSHETGFTAVEMVERWVWSGDLAGLGNINILEFTGLEASTFPIGLDFDTTHLSHVHFLTLHYVQL